MRILLLITLLAFTGCGKRVLTAESVNTVKQPNVRFKVEKIVSFGDAHVCAIEDTIGTNDFIVVLYNGVALQPIERK